MSSLIKKEEVLSMTVTPLFSRRGLYAFDGSCLPPFWPGWAVFAPALHYCQVKRPFLPPAAGSRNMDVYTLGIDYGTNSVRALIVSVANGAEVATAVWGYEHGTAGVILSRATSLGWLSSMECVAPSISLSRASGSSFRKACAIARAVSC